MLYKKKYGVRFTYIYKNIHCVCTANQNRKIYSPTAFKGILNIISKYTVIKNAKSMGVGAISGLDPSVCLTSRSGHGTLIVAELQTEGSKHT